jgi:hypothetical protein
MRRGRRRSDFLAHITMAKLKTHPVVVLWRVARVRKEWRRKWKQSEMERGNPGLTMKRMEMEMENDD